MSAASLPTFAIVLLLVPALSASAQVIYSDKASFLAATGGASATGPIPNLGSFVNVVTVGSVQLTKGPNATDIWVGTSGNPIVTDWTSLHDGHEIALGGSEDLDVQLGSPVFSFGFDFVEPSRDYDDVAWLDSTFSVTLISGNQSVGSFQFNAVDDALAFYGAWSVQSFDRVAIREIAGDRGDEYFGEFYTGITPVPEAAHITVASAACVASWAGWRALGRSRIRR